MSSPYIPLGQTAISPFFLTADAEGLIAFLREAFEALEVTRTERDGNIMHAALTIYGAVVMVGSRQKAYVNSTHLYVPDVDVAFEKCISLGATALSEPKTFPYGDRSAGIKDPFGNTWWIGTHVGDQNGGTNG